MFAWHPSQDGLAKSWWGDRYQLDSGQYVANLCGGSRALADGEPDLGGLPAHEPDRWPSTAGLSVTVGILAAVVAVGLAVLRARRRASAD